MSPQPDNATIAIDLESDGVTTIASARALDPLEQLLAGVQTVRPEFSDNIVGTGIARCRKDDRFDPDIGNYLASARAIRDFVSQVEQRVLAAVETEQEAKMREFGEDLAEGINDLIDGFNDALARAGLGQLVGGR